MTSENKRPNYALRTGIGIVIVILSLNLGLYFFTIVGIIIAVSGIRGLKKQKDNSEDGTIVSGVNKAMPDNNTFVRSAESYGDTHKSSKEDPKYKSDSSNVCPICKELSANGYCIKCGYRFK